MREQRGTLHTASITTVQTASVDQKHHLFVVAAVVEFPVWFHQLRLEWRKLIVMLLLGICKMTMRWSKIWLVCEIQSSQCGDQRMRLDLNKIEFYDTLKRCSCLEDSSIRQTQSTTTKHFSFLSLANKFRIFIKKLQNEKNTRETIWRKPTNPHNGWPL